MSMELIEFLDAVRPLLAELDGIEAVRYPHKPITNIDYPRPKHSRNELHEQIAALTRQFANGEKSNEASR